jgi:glycosyltransferase involved in cell wall biosynthesis
VATDSGGPGEIVVEGKTGFLVPVGDSAQVADRLLTLLRNPNRADEMGFEGYLRVEAKFSRERFVSSFMDVVREAVA